MICMFLRELRLERTIELITRALAGDIAAWILLDDETIGAGEEMRTETVRSPAARGCDQCKDPPLPLDDPQLN